MMKMRQQQQLKSTSINVSNQNALLFSNKPPNIAHGDYVKEPPINMANYNVNDYERDESPVSVISHSATIVSQPSSACTSMEHHLNHLISNSNSIHRQRIGNPNHQSPFSQSMGTSGASTSEDDSSANSSITTTFIAVPPKQEEPSKKAQQHAYYRKGIVRKSTFNNHSEKEGSIRTSTKAVKRSSSHSEADHVTDSVKSDHDDDDDDDHMISIDFQGLQEAPMVARDNFLRSYGSKLVGEHVVGKISATLEHYGEYRREEHKLSRSTSHAHKEFIAVRPVLNSPASNVRNHAESYSMAGAFLNVGKPKEEPVKGPPMGAKPSITTPSLVSRQRSINSAKLAVPSKWDDAEKWLCYDNNPYHQKAKCSSTSRQTLHGNRSTPSSGGRMVDYNKQLNCKEGCAIPSIGGLNKAFERRSDQSSSPSRVLNVSKAPECKVNAAHAVVANHLMLQNTDFASGNVAHSNVGAISRGNHVCVSSSSSSNELVENVMLAYGYLDILKRKWNEVPQAKTCQKSTVDDYMSSGEIINSHHALNCRLAAVSVSDGEIYRQVNCQQSHIASRMSASTGPMPGDEKTTRPASSRNWMRSNSDALRTLGKCDYLNIGGERMSRENLQNVAAKVCASDGEACGNYASDQQLKRSASYTQRFKQHQILQKLRRKCSPRKGAYAITPSGKTKEEEVGGNTLSTNACLQKEFVVQTPTHGRSASMKDACTEVSPSLSRRDMGTQMTPPASSPITPKCTSPLQNTSPARHNTPTRTSPTINREKNDVNTSRENGDGTNASVHRSSRCDNVSALELESFHWAKLELREPPSGAQTSEKNSGLGFVYNECSPAYGVEDENVDSKDGDVEGQCAEDEVNSGGIIMSSRIGALEARAAAWENAERAKFNAKFKREEARIKAWENLQKAKAETDLKKLEVKLERLRSKATEKVLNRVAAAEKRAEEMRAAAEAQQAEQMRKVRERVCNLRKNALFPGSFAVCFARSYMP